MAKERFSKKTVAEYLFRVGDWENKKHQIDWGNGTAQFRKDLLSVLIHQAPEHLDRIISKIVDYGSVRRIESIVNEFHLERPKDSNG